MTPFEQQLADTPLRSLPPEWRDCILPERPRPSAGVVPFLRGFLWPHPLAWGVVAACWVAILILNFSGPQGPQLYATSPPGSRPRVDSAVDLWCVWQLERQYWNWIEGSEIPHPIDRNKL